MGMTLLTATLLLTTLLLTTLSITSTKPHHQRWEV